jgi:antitoxin (DNA-binding transcriptional repressor) of toxin-antitoxin stability system
MKPKTYDLKQAAAQLSRIVRDAQAGESCLITRHGVPPAAPTSVEQWEAQRLRPSSNTGILALRGTGRGLWNTRAATTVKKLRGEWGE